MAIDTGRAIALLVAALLRARQRAMRDGNILLGQIDADLIRVSYAIAALGRSGTVLDRALATILLRQIQQALVLAGADISRRIQTAMGIAALGVVEETNAALGIFGVLTVAGQPITLAALAAAQEIRGTSLRTLVNRHMEDALLDVRRIIEAGIARGAASSEVSRQIALVIRSRTQGELDAKGLASIAYDARRIGRSEIMNALRSSYRRTLSETGVVAAVQFTVSSAHSIRDECDDLAEANQYGFGPGYYPPERFPDGPHPHCACYAGDIILKDAAEWPLAA